MGKFLGANLIALGEYTNFKKALKKINIDQDKKILLFFLYSFVVKYLKFSNFVFDIITIKRYIN